MIAFPVYNYGTEFWYQKVGETMKGGHAVTVVGYNEIGFIIRNSWGTDWGNAGYTALPYAHIGETNGKSGQRSTSKQDRINRHQNLATTLLLLSAELLNDSLGYAAVGLPEAVNARQ